MHEAIVDIRLRPGPVLPPGGSINLRIRRDAKSCTCWCNNFEKRTPILVVCYTDDTRYLQVLQTDNKFMGPMRHASEHFISRENVQLLLLLFIHDS